MSRRKVRGVKDQYEVYPYPHRDSADEATRLVRTLGGNLDGISHFLFGGRRDFAKPFRVLVAGGGTGDALIYLAQQLADRGCPSRVTYLDLSEASRAIAAKRTAIRRLDIDFHTGSLLDVAGMGLGEFDYIDCSGVLHHLPDPDAGLAALAGVLAPDGGMGIMLYGTSGRAGIYPMQEMLRLVAPPSLPAGERLAVAKRLLAALPATNLLRRNPGLATATDDAEIFDLLLHSRDRAYSVAEIGALVAGAGLSLRAFVPPACYDPASYCADAEVLRRLDTASPLGRAAFAEGLVSILPKHIFYVAGAGNTHTPPAPSDAAIPVWHDGFAFPADKLGQTFQFGKNRGPVAAQVTVTPEVAAVARLIDGATPLGEIRRRCGLTPAGFQAGFKPLWSLHGLFYLFLAASP